MFGIITLSDVKGGMFASSFMVLYNALFGTVTEQSIILCYAIVTLVIGLFVKHIWNRVASYPDAPITKFANKIGDWIASIGR